MTRVIDTSVILAVLLEEKGADVAARLVPGGTMSSVNLAEVISKCLERGLPADLGRSYIVGSGVEVVPFDSNMALLSSKFVTLARKGVFSLGDRACIATAAKLGATAVTADRVWAELDLPCPVELIR